MKESEQVQSASMSRRRFLYGSSALALGFVTTGRRSAMAAETRPLRVAAVMTCFTYRSHAHVILENFLEDYPFNGERINSGCKVVSFYVDQFPADDMARAIAKEYGIPIFPTIEAALTLGGKNLEADAVLSIGEHGSYPVNAKGQQEYPRKRFFDDIIATFKKTEKVCPVFNDKHLSYRWDWAKEMVDASNTMGFALMAGSSVPLATRRPPLEIPIGSKIVDAVSIHGGGVESYDFHGLEVLQSVVEARAGAETGVKEVQFLNGEALWKASDEGKWSIDLADAAMRAELGPDTPTLRELAAKSGFANPHGILVTYRDGFRAAMLKVGESGTRWNFACRVEGDSKPRATAYYVGPWENRNLFKALSHAIQIHFREKKPPYPLERTLLTTGILAAAMDSRYEGNKPIATDWLDIAYEPTDFRRCREMGATWKLLPPDTPQPEGMHRYSKK